MIGAGIVLVDGLFHQPEAQRLRVEAQVLRRVGGDCGQMMYARELKYHFILLPLGRSGPSQIRIQWRAACWMEDKPAIAAVKGMDGSALFSDSEQRQKNVQERRRGQM